MKKIILITTILLSSILLTSCGRYTQEEIEEGKKYCENVGQDFRLEDLPIMFGGDKYFCDTKQVENNVFTCIKEYTNGLDEKYNNPDTVSNLREDDYSQVVKTCNDIFGDKK